MVLNEKSDSNKIAKELLDEVLTSILDDIDFNMKGKKLIDDEYQVKHPAVFVRCQPKSTAGKSLLTLKLCERDQRKNDPLKEIDESDPNYFPLSVKLLNTDLILNLAVSKRDTFEEVINHILHKCRVDPEIKESIDLPFKSSKGYELRVCLDGEIIYDLKPLEKTHKIESINLDTVALCSNKNYTQSSSLPISKKLKPPENPKVI